LIREACRSWIDYRSRISVAAQEGSIKWLGLEVAMMAGDNERTASPLIAAVAMVISSINVLGNSARFSARPAARPPAATGVQ